MYQTWDGKWDEKMGREMALNKIALPITSDGNRFQFPKSIIGNKSNSILELESVSWCADCGI